MTKRWWMQMAAAWAALAIAALAAPTAQARTPASTAGALCDPAAVRVVLLPFEAREAYTLAYAELASPHAGQVRQTYTVRVEDCTAIVGYASPVLYVARELAQDDCAFDTVLAHEREHLAIYRRALADLEARIRAAALTRPLFDAARLELQAVRAEHLAFDRAEDVARRNARACGGSILRLLHPQRMAGSGRY